ncbi:uncharacterized protein N7477_009097 [Penicillium maclennaniae]|uniref:uncharacterized protein n=1 Tax=Penicillium maclennaniae TaxID=1343394 RepID=UPI0025414E99|nr:uncharacterized protein N7477_009097 [Penicillium maclennaniae]KAJ5661481.1 hypothetical protein N7477_009097 [Penicillium maclennaniae]
MDFQVCYTQQATLIGVFYKYIPTSFISFYIGRSVSGMNHTSGLPRSRSVESLQNKSFICAKAYPILRHLQILVSTDSFESSGSRDFDIDTTFNNWIDGAQWLNPDLINWVS